MAVEQLPEDFIVNRVVDLPTVVVVRIDDSTFGLRFTRNQLSNAQFRCATSLAMALSAAACGRKPTAYLNVVAVTEKVRLGIVSS